MKLFKHLIAKLLQAKPHETVVTQTTCLHKQQDCDKMLPYTAHDPTPAPVLCPPYHQRRFNLTWATYQQAIT